MDLKRPLVVLAVAGVLTGCSSSSGSNTDVDRGTTDCGAAEAGAQDRADCSDSEDAPSSESSASSSQSG
ncbi:hypothetical protein DQ238_06320 [Geodermatophilus sp. TF02-6]|uniref:hypothetical protein n=1 Tax=Geodermatophilus sp. TF02-6 TaxID=2250575 RepID=UPI000DEB5ECC|nr:hypothetical protein [Geodermatophilus sp. TF02-6]RBY81646.1 hypothetical protein DQ238_06320 [Geodermatophilus sp. TF02-6]